MQLGVAVIGGGLAGSEAAWQLAERGAGVCLYEMRPAKQTGAHQTPNLAELVCSNSLGSKLPDRASGILMAEMRHMGSKLLSVAESLAVPAGSALAVDRGRFAREVSNLIEAHPNIRLIRKEVRKIPEGIVIIASGPLTSPGLSEELARLTGADRLYFFDALAPIVEGASIDSEIAFRASRYQRGESSGGDYLNCPFTKEEYEEFVDALLQAERIPLRNFEARLMQGVKAGPGKFFEACLPVEVMAERGRESLAFGPMRPVGLIDRRSGKRPYAILQLRQDDLMGEFYNLVGFQTNLRYDEQKRVFRMVPGLAGARFVRYGQMHRNTFLNSPMILEPSLEFREKKGLFIAGQISGVEGYLGNIATGLLAGVNAARLIKGRAPIVLPRETMLGALCHYVAHANPENFQPMKANLGLLPPLADERARGNRRRRARGYAERSAREMAYVWPSSARYCV